MKRTIDWTSAPPSSPLGAAGRLRRTAPFAVVFIAIGILYFVLEDQSLTAGEVIALIAVPAVTVALVMTLHWERLPRWVSDLVPLVAIGYVVMVQVFALPENVDLGALILLPVMWSALYGSAAAALTTTLVAIGSIVGLELWEEFADIPVGFTGWAEVAALSFTATMLAVFTVTARQHARVDQLTGIANRRAWDELLHAEIQRSQALHRPVRVAIIDLDNFKAYNDLHGHAGGDEHLRECAKVWSAALRHTDAIARVGGEEFAVLIREAGDDEAEVVMERLRTLTPNGQTCSIGLATWDGTEPPGHLTLRADDALYSAKEAGRNRVVVALMTA